MAPASTGLAELGKIVFFMVFVLPAVLLATSALTVWLSIKLGTRAVVVCSIIAPLLAIGNAAFLGVLLAQSGRGAPTNSNMF